MFGKKEEKQNPGEVMGLIGRGMSVEGRMGFDGTIRIDGNFKGEISSEGTLLIGEGALIEGEINVDSAIISGEVKGIVNTKNKVELKSPAKIRGDIRTPTLIIGEGVTFDGNCIMTKRDRGELKSAEEVIGYGESGIKG